MALCIEQLAQQAYDHDKVLNSLRVGSFWLPIEVAKKQVLSCSLRDRRRNNVMLSTVGQGTVQRCGHFGTSGPRARADNAVAFP